MKIKKTIKLLRIEHYIKNALIFVPLLFSGQLGNGKKLLTALVGFLAFSCICSSVYIFNDIKDKERDRCHPQKCKRPIASGTISVKFAVCLFSVVLICGYVCNYFVFDLWGTIWLSLYLAINLGYSLGLKNIPILDVLLITAGFLLRLFYGAAITGISISNWLYLTVFVFSLYLAFGKRQGEKIRSGGSTSSRIVLKEYPEAFLDKAMSLCLTLTNGFYALWCMDKADAAASSTLQGDPFILTFPIVLIITLRYSMDLEKGTDGDPVEVLTKDKVLPGLVLLFIVVMVTILYFI